MDSERKCMWRRRHLDVLFVRSIQVGLSSRLHRPPDRLHLDTGAVYQHQLLLPPPQIQPPPHLRRPHLGRTLISLLTIVITRSFLVLCCVYCCGVMFFKFKALATGADGVHLNRLSDGIRLCTVPALSAYAATITKQPALLLEYR